MCIMVMDSGFPSCAVNVVFFLSTFFPSKIASQLLLVVSVFSVDLKGPKTIGSYLN